MKGLWDEFDALEAPYVCTCVCSCENGERDQRKRLIQFLIGLDDSYANVRGQILLMQPLPSVVKAYNMIRPEEKQREGLIAKPPTFAIFLTFSNNKRHNQNNFKGNRSTYSQGESSERRNYNQGETSKRMSLFRKGVICGNYGKEGHIKEQCYKIVGYPISHPLHRKYQPPKPQKQEYKPNMTVNMATTQEDPSAQAKQPQTAQPNTLSDAHFSARIDMLQNQINQVLIMMQNNKKDTIHGIFSSTSITIPKFIATLVSNLKSTWIIDSGASDHISITLTFMINIKTFTKPIHITYPMDTPPKSPHMVL
ncbi:hypothetical protein Tco_0932535 [Tanacetum coccineum]